MSRKEQGTFIIDPITPREQDRAGYFRIGYVTLFVPPENIVCRRVANSDSFTPMRSLGTIYTGTNRARWEVTVNFRVATLPYEIDPFMQWRQLEDIVAYFRCAPFVEVENSLIRQAMVKDLGTADDSMRMAFAMREMTVVTDPDDDSLQVNLILVFFNYFPYSLDFAYLAGTSGGEGQKGNAHQSPEFKKYIDNWKNANLHSVDGFEPFDEQEDGSLKLVWREYAVVTPNSATLPGAGYAQDTRSFVTDSPNTGAGVTTASTLVQNGNQRRSYTNPLVVTPADLPPNISALIDQYASTYGLDSAVIKRQAWVESGGDQSRVSNKGAVGVMQLMPKTAARLGVDPTNVEQNILGGCKQMAYLLDRPYINGDYSLALAAYNAGEGNVQKYGGIPPFPETKNYVAKILGNAVTVAGSSPSSSNASVSRLLGGQNVSADIQSIAAWGEQNILSPIREKFGAVNITSGYRSSARNQQVNGADDSFHLYSTTPIPRGAADIYIPNSAGRQDPELVKELFNWLVESDLPFDKVILESSGSQPSVVHVQWYKLNDGQSAPRARTAWTGSTFGQSNYVQVAMKSSSDPQTPGVSHPSLQSVSTKAAHTNPSQLPIHKVNRLASTVGPIVLDMNKHGWDIDHWTDYAVFMYREHITELGSANGNVSPLNTVPEQMTVTMVNNFATIPLAAYQYPILQHVGPSETLVTVSVSSVGIREKEDSEPIHPVLPELGQMSAILDANYLITRGQIMAAGANHRMRSVAVHNQVLNLMGVHHIKPQAFTVETIPDSSDAVQVNLVGSIYYKILEQSKEWLVNPGISDHLDVLPDFLKTNRAVIDILNSADPRIQAKYAELKKFLNGWQNGDYQTARNVIDSAVSNNQNLEPDVKASKVVMSSSRLNEIGGVLQRYIVKNEFENLTPLVNKAATTTSSSDFTLVELMQLAALCHQVRERLLSVGGTVAKEGVKQTEIPNVSLMWEALKNTAAFKILTGKFSDSGKLIDVANFLGGAGNELDEVTRKSAGSDPTQLSSVYRSVLNPSTYDISGRVAAFNFDLQMISLLSEPSVSGEWKKVSGIDKQSNDTGRQGHGAYRDFGLKDLDIDGRDNNPGSYFVDYSGEHKSNMLTQVKAAMKAATNIASTLNQATVPSASLIAKSNADFLNTQTADSVLERVGFSSRSMGSAFPTFKLMLIEENNDGPFYMLDDFYDYSSVLDIEIIRYQDKPDTAIIQLSNLGGVLSHKLFDASVLGTMEVDLKDRTLKYKANPDQTALGSLLGDTSVNPDPTIGGKQVEAPGGATVDEGIDTGGLDVFDTGIKAPDGRKYLLQGMNMQSGIKTDSGYKTAPFQYFPLQAGSKIQVRMGYSNDPDKLIPVFGGVVTDIEGSDILTITAQGYQIELINAQAKSSNLIFTDYGGYWPFNEAGDVRSVMESLLSSSDARHFGHWQIGRTQSLPILTGFTWSSLAADFFSRFQATQAIANGLRTATDRSGENILINHVVMPDGKFVDNSTERQKKVSLLAKRTWEDRNDNTTFGDLFFKTFQYSVPRKKNFTTWDLLKDISRRYPEYILSVKPYGFPYAADATLVFGHPLDFYYSRDPLPSDQEQINSANKDNSLFRSWYDGKDSNPAAGRQQVAEGSGRAQVLRMFDLLLNDPNPVIKHVTGNGQDLFAGNINTNSSSTLSSDVFWASVSKDPDGFSYALTKLESLIASIDGSSLSQLMTRLRFNLAANTSYKSDILHALDTVEAVRRSWEGFIQSQAPGARSRVRPIRRFHFADFNSIIKNDISLNDKIYNTVQIDGKIRAANANIPDVYRRMVNVDQLCVDVENNVDDLGLEDVYAQSFLKEEVGKMYRGELVLRGSPEIEPFDVVFVNDPSTGMYGPIEVESVIHSFGADTGYISIVKPRAVVMINEMVTGELLRQLGIAWYVAQPTINSMFDDYNSDTIMQEDKQKSNPTKDAVTTVGVGAAASLGTGIALLSSGSGFLPAAPFLLPGLLTMGVAGLAMLGLSDAINHGNMIYIVPMSRLGRPWYAGLNGYTISDVGYTIGQRWRRFLRQEIQPTLFMFKTLTNTNPNKPPV